MKQSKLNVLRAQMACRMASENMAWTPQGIIDRVDEVLAACGITAGAPAEAPTAPGPDYQALRKPKEFDFFDAARKVCNGAVKEMRTCPPSAYNIIDMRGTRLCWRGGDTVSINEAVVTTKWILIGNDDKPVYE